ncbi:MAG: di- and tricarboxylate transporter [Phycisphaerae bacterium]|nr:MAG: di- and tricarboxylate transporter [Phycisphaerae bacterium]
MTPALVRSLKLALGVAVALALYALLGPSTGFSEQARRTAAAAALIAVWWVTEALPLEATGLLPIALFPLLGIADLKQASAPYANNVIFLFLAGMLLGQAMETWNLHRRLALGVLRAFGQGPAMLVGGFLVATAFVSMWVSNLAASVMMAPIALSVATAFSVRDAGPSFRPALLLAVAFGASIGGLGTLIGTPPTAQFAAFMAADVNRPVTFLEWLKIGLPLQAVMLPLAWLILTRLAFRVPARAARVEGSHAATDLGPWSWEERAVAIVFLLAAAGWIFTPVLAKWSALDGTLAGAILARVTDTGVGVTCAIALFIIPARTRTDQPNPTPRGLLTWRDAEKVHWGVLLLFGGGLSLAETLTRHGVDARLAHLAEPLHSLPLFFTLWIITLGAIILTEFASNTALVAAGLPIALGMSKALGVAPEVLLVTITLAASLGFMLPAGTPPNAVVFATRQVTMRQMMRGGLLLDLAASLLVPLLVLACAKAGVLPGV